MQQLLETYESLFSALWDRMAAMLGGFTTYSLIERALFEAGKEYPLTRGLILRDNGLDFSALEQRTEAIDNVEFRTAMNTLVVDIVEILAEQIGRVMAERIVGKVVEMDEKARE
jgi:hypothetical protein